VSKTLASRGGAQGNFALLRALGASEAIKAAGVGCGGKGGPKDSSQIRPFLPPFYWYIQRLVHFVNGVCQNHPISAMGWTGNGVWLELVVT